MYILRFLTVRVGGRGKGKSKTKLPIKALQKNNRIGGKWWKRLAREKKESSDKNGSLIEKSGKKIGVFEDEITIWRARMRLKEPGASRNNINPRMILLLLYQRRRIPANHHECFDLESTGLESPRAFHEFRQLLIATSPRLVFLCETRLTSQRCSLWKAILGFTGHLVVDAEGKKGGLMLLWDQTVSISILSYSQGHIDCDVEATGREWQFTGFCGNPITDLRRFSWQLLGRIHDNRRNKDTPWLVG